MTKDEMLAIRACSTPAGEPASHNDPEPPHGDVIFYVVLMVITFVAFVWFVWSGGVMP